MSIEIRRAVLVTARATAATLIGAASALALCGVADAAPQSQDDCRAYEITLHGGGQPTHRCVVKNDVTNDVVTPNAISRICINDGNDLILYWNGPVGAAGPILCIRGQGWTNLDATQPDGRNWNDRASAWWAGCSAGHFDQNGGLFPGKQQGFSGGVGASAPSGNFDGVGGHLPNDSLSVVTLDSDC